MKSKECAALAVAVTGLALLTAAFAVSLSTPRAHEREPMAILMAGV